MDELKPCPFCGNTDIVLVGKKRKQGENANEPFDPYYFAFCSRCGGSVWGNRDKDVVIDAWNTRDGKRE